MCSCPVAGQTPQKAMGCVPPGVGSVGSLGRKDMGDQGGHEAVDTAYGLVS